MVTGNLTSDSAPLGPWEKRGIACTCAPSNESLGLAIAFHLSMLVPTLEDSDKTKVRLGSSCHNLSKKNSVSQFELLIFVKN